MNNHSYIFSKKESIVIPSRSIVLDVVQATLKERIDVFVIQLVMDVTALFAETNQAHLPQGPAYLCL
jgi:hypothetical protein